MRTLVGGFVTGVVALGLLVSAAVVEAQLPPPGRAGRGAVGAGQASRVLQGQNARRQQLENQIWAEHEAQVARELNLGAETRARYSEIVRRFRQSRTELAREEATLRRRTQAALQGAEDPGAVIQDLIRLREREAALFREETEALLGVLEPGQVLRLFRRREALTDRVRELQGGGGRAGRGGGGVELPLGGGGNR